MQKKVFDKLQKQKKLLKAGAETKKYKIKIQNNSWCAKQTNFLADVWEIITSQINTIAFVNFHITYLYFSLLQYAGFLLGVLGMIKI